MTMLLALLTSFTIQGPAPDAQAPVQAARIFKVLPAHELLATPRPPAPLPTASAISWPEDSANEVVLLTKTPPPLLGGDELVDLVRRVAGAKWFEGDQPASIGMAGAALVTSGSAEAVREIEAALWRIQNTLARPIRVGAALYELQKDVNLPPTVAREQLAELTRGLRPLWSMTVGTRSGAAAELSSVTRSPFLGDVNVEVAQDSKIGDPIVSDVFEGTQVLAEPHVLADGKSLALYCQFAFGERGHQRTIPTGVPELGTLDVPDVRFLAGTLSGRIESGGALVLRLQGAREGASNLLLVVSAEAKAVPQDAGKPAFIPVSALLSRAIQTEKDQRLGPDSGDELAAILHDAIASGESDVSLPIFGGQLVVEATPAAGDEALRLVRYWEDQTLQTVRMEFRTTQAAADSPAEPAMLLALSFPCIVGRTHRIRAGSETTELRDYEVEIAQKAAISNPVVERLFRGLALTATVHPLAQGLGVTAEALVTDAPAPARRATEIKGVGDLHPARRSKVTFTHDGPATLGEDLQLGESHVLQLDAQRVRLRQTLRVSAQ
jgi:hypothetical protein